MQLGVNFIKTTSFKDRFEDLVWDMDIKPDVLEYKWNLLMGEFTFSEKTTKWFKDMYDIRGSWIPAFFNDFPRCGLMKTTSRSESMNSFFNSYSQDGNFLISFMMNYDNAIQKMRYSQKELDHKTKGAQYIMKSPREIEKHAANMYTSKMFFEVQEEMFKGAWFCEVTEFNQGEGWELYAINHLNKKHEVKAKYKVFSLLVTAEYTLILTYDYPNKIICVLYCLLVTSEYTHILTYDFHDKIICVLYCFLFLTYNRL